MGLEMRLKALEALALVDGDFRRRLLDDPVKAAKDLDIELSVQQAEQVVRAKELLERLAKAERPRLPDHGIPGNMVMSLATPKMPPPPPPPIDKRSLRPGRKPGA